MARGRRIAVAIAATALALGTLVAAGCGGDDDSAAGTTSAAAGSDLSGDITIDGSSTVGPLTSAAAEAFNGENSGVNITVGTSGTGGGFELFCKGETDISDASRAIKPEEAAACKSGGVTYVELRVASDGITMVTSNALERRRQRQPHDRSAEGDLGPRLDDQQLEGHPPRGHLQRRAAHAGGPRLAVGHLRLLQREGPRHERGR